jgi:nitroimidazol reductase NimA-like FMN-containing flavoprotein (pyridoxamine 5'-phosphate oxidase superfamily)
MTITGLTKRQVFLLDKMWSIKSIEEYEEWKLGLSEQTMNTVDTLEQLVYWAELDEISCVSDAARVLKGYRLGGSGLKR